MAKQRATSFRKVVVCHTNDFKSNINDKIKIWAEANGGTFQKELTTNVTHLVCSKPAWKRCCPIVKKARKMKTVFIVKYDWLEDSLLKKPVRALPVKEYLWDHPGFDLVKWISKNRKRSAATSSTDQSKVLCNNAMVPRAKQVQLAGASFDQAKNEFERDMGTAGFHPYFDSTGFVYIVNLLRKDIVRDCLEQYKIKVGHDPPSIPYDVIPGFYTTLHFLPAPESFSAAPVIYSTTSSHLRLSNVHLSKPWAQCLQLFESDSQPHTYACYVQYTRPRLKTATVTLAPPGSTWEFAWTMFEKRYKAQVGKAWNERPGRDRDINLDGGDEHWRYQAPSIGQPEGLRGKLVGKEDDIVGVEEEISTKEEILRQTYSEIVTISEDDSDANV